MIWVKNVRSQLDLLIFETAGPLISNDLKRLGGLLQGHYQKLAHGCTKAFLDKEPNHD